MPAALFIAIGASCALAVNAACRRVRRWLRPARVPDFGAIASASSNDGIVVQSLDGTIIWANPAYTRLFGLPLDRIVGRKPQSFCLPPDSRMSPAAIAAFRYDPADPTWRKLTLVQNRRADGTLFWNQIQTSFRDMGDDRILAVLVCRDVTEDVEQAQTLRRTTAELAYIADHDSLTGVANRKKFREFIDAALTAAGADGPRLGLLQIDMDKFKAINDTLGHAAGDAALRHVSGIISRNLRKTDLLARIGGDEFVAVCAGISDESELLRIGRALCEAVKEPLYCDGHRVSVTISVGAVIVDPRDRDVDHLLQRSDFALYDVKRRGRNNVTIYNSELHGEAQLRNRLAEQLHHAVQTDALTFYFQPTIDLRSGEVRGFEALARWQHAAHGLMHPSLFIPLAREMKLLRQIDMAALNAIGRLHKQLSAAGFHHIRVGINGSHNILKDPDHLARLPAAIGAHSVLPRSVVIELAERDVFGQPDRIACNVAAISKLVDTGFSVLIDGFGSGYAGILHIEHLDVAGFKIEKALIRHLDSAPACERITAMLMQFSREKNIYCVASGIETAAQARLVTSLGGTVGQGNHFARAMPPSDVIDWLLRRQATRDMEAAS